MDYRDRIIEDLAKKACVRVSRQCIFALQKMTEGMQSGDDTPLRNVWEEVCIQVQFQYSFFWEAYLETIRQIILSKVQSLEGSVKQAIWLQTDEGMRWELDEEDQEQSSPYGEGDIVDYVLHNFVLASAADWSNKRIEYFLERYSILD